MPANLPPFAVDRRTVLAGAAGGAALTALAACNAGSGPSPSSEPAGKKLAVVSALPIGKATAVTLPNGAKAMLTRTTGSTVVCFSAVCTHQGCTVQPNGAELDCPCHGSRFNALTGAVLQGPAPRALPAIPVQVVDGDVVTS